MFLSALYCLNCAFLHAASDVLKKHKEEFFRVTNAKLNLLELERKNVISDSHVKEIESADDGKAQELLFKHLDRNADVAALKEYCQVTMSAKAFPKMQDLGRKMLADLLPQGLLVLVMSCVCRCVCSCVCTYLWIVLLACWNVLYTLFASDLWVLIHDVKAQLTDMDGNGNASYVPDP